MLFEVQVFISTVAFVIACLISSAGWSTDNGLSGLFFSAVGATLFLVVLDWTGLLATIVGA